jgi:hypothetical protein
LEVVVLLDLFKGRLGFLVVEVDKRILFVALVLRLLFLVLVVVTVLKLALLAVPVGG